MDDLAKVLLLLGSSALLYILGRRFSELKGTNAFQPPPITELEPGEPKPHNVPLVGREIPFPFDVNELAAKYGPGFKRPAILNYYFRQTDLVAGPPDPNRFYDELFVELRGEHSDHSWTAQFLVTTPAGLEALMAEQRSDFFDVSGATIIVQRYDLKTILRAVLEHYAEPNNPMTLEPILPEPDKRHEGE